MQTLELCAAEVPGGVEQLSCWRKPDGAAADSIVLCGSSVEEAFCEDSFSALAFAFDSHFPMLVCFKTGLGFGGGEGGGGGVGGGGVGDGTRALDDGWHAVCIIEIM